MKKILPLVIFGLFSVMSFGQTPLHSFECRIKSAQSLNPSQIAYYITKGNYENYRLKNRRTVLSFDNGFDIILVSATEAQTAGLIKNAEAYQADFLPKFKMPVFHMTPDGRVSAAYPVINSKYSTEKQKWWLKIYD